ncbi:MAG: hypothetical protein ACWA44_02630 [Thiotrichales bacterium]
MEFLKQKKAEAVKAKIEANITDLVREIAEQTGIRNADEMFIYLLESGYELLPYPIRLVVKKEVFVSVINENRKKVSEIILHYTK